MSGEHLLELLGDPTATSPGPVACCHSGRTMSIWRSSALNRRTGMSLAATKAPAAARKRSPMCDMIAGDGMGHPDDQS